MKILVIFTGGTIGSSIQDGYIAPDMEKKYKLIQLYGEETKDHQQFDVDVPYMLLSENLNGVYLTKLIHCVQKHMETKIYDGIIITHGTDTLHYTAAALFIIFENTDIPIMLVSSNYPLEDKRANGLHNFKEAVRYIRRKCAPGVYVPYKNRNEEVKIFQPKYIVNYDIYSDEIRTMDTNGKESIDEEQYGILKNHKVHPDTIQLNEYSPVAYIRPYPGIRYEISDKTKAVLFGSYHSGTINTADKCFVEFCKKMKDEEIPMYICGVPQEIGYESTKCYKELGVNVLPYGTDIYWYMKLWLNFS